MGKRILLVVTTALLIAAARPIEPIARAGEPPLLVVANVHFPTNNISLADLKSAFRGRATTIDGKRLIPINHPLDSPLRVAFDRIVLGLEPAEVGRFWIDRRIRDEGSPPKTVPSPELAVRIAASLPTALTYATPAMLNPKVKVLSIDGKTAGSPGYALTPH